MSWYSIVRRGGTTTTLWDPSQLSGLDAWYDADDASTLTLSGSAVSQWNDKSGNNHHASQSTQALQPALTTGGLNGLDVVTLTQDYLDVPSLQLSGWDHQVFVVATLESSSGNFGRLVDFTQSDGSALFSPFNRFRNDPQIYNNVSGLGTARFTTGYGSAFIAASNVTSAGGNLYANGVFVGNISQFQPTVNATDGLRIGAQRNDGTVNFDGLIAELIVCDDQTASEREKVEGYLAHKWGLTANLPVGHPYKTTAPTA